MKTTLFRAGAVHGQPGATALIASGADIAWVGPVEEAPVRADEVVDLGDCWLAPAFVDAHLHATATGLALTGLDLTDCTSLGQALARVAEHSRRLRGGVLLGTGWDETRWSEGRPPTAHELDRASHGGVVYLARTDVHSAVASSALLAAVPEAAGAAGFMGEGLVRQEAHHLVRRTALAAITPGQRRAAQRAALDQAAGLGIGCVHECAGPDISSEEDLTDLLALEHVVERVGYWGELGAVDRARDLGAAGAAGDLFVDGALGSRTACLSHPYADGDGSGHSYLGVDEVAAHVSACTRAGLQAGFHAIGDAALQVVTDALSQVATELGLTALRRVRHRVEHVEMLTAPQIAVLARCGVIASVQPAFDARWGGPDGMYAARLGWQRAAGMNPYAALHTAGVELALGSDSPVTPPDPWGAVRAAVEHRTPGSGLTPTAAFHAHTVGGRLAGRQDGGGVLRPGAPATFAAWDLPGPLVGGLPDLHDGLPHCRAAAVRGRLGLG